VNRVRKISLYLFGVSLTVAGVAYMLAGRHIGDAGVTVYPLLTTVRQADDVRRYELALIVGRFSATIAALSLVVHLFVLNKQINPTVGNE
jgi:hypothetical protein